MLVNLYQQVGTCYFFINNLPYLDSKYITIRSIKSNNAENLLAVYILLLIKYARHAINVYYVVDPVKFIEKFDRITTKYGSVYIEDDNVSITNINASLIKATSKNVSVNLVTYDSPVIGRTKNTVNISSVDLGYIMTEVKRKFSSETLVHCLTTFWKTITIYSANCLLCGILPAYKTETEIYVLGIKFPILMVKKKVIIRGSLLRYFPFCYDKNNHLCTVGGLSLNETTVTDMTVPVLDEARINYVIAEILPIRAYLNHDLLGIIDFIGFH